MGLDERSSGSQEQSEQASHPAVMPESKFGCMLEYPSIFKYFERDREVKILKCGQPAGKN